MQQAIQAMGEAKRPEDRFPVAVCKDDREDPIVLMRWGDFLELITEWKHGRREETENETETESR